MGGGLIFLPFAKFYFIDHLGYTPEFLRIIIATSATIIACNGLSASIQHYRKKNIDMKMLPYFAAACILGSRIGVLMVDHLPLNVVRYALAAFLLFSAARMLRRKNTREAGAVLTPKKRLQIGGIGFGLSTLLSMLGMGGGALMTPVLNVVYSQPLKKAIGTAAMFTFTLSGTACFYYLLEPSIPSPANHFMVGYVDLQIAALVAGGGILGAWTGARLLQRSNVEVIKGIFAAVLVGGAIKMIW